MTITNNLQRYAVLDGLALFLATADHREPPHDLNQTEWSAQITAAHELADQLEREVPNAPIPFPPAA